MATHPQDVFWLTRSDHGVCVWRGKPTRTLITHWWTGSESGATIQADMPEFVFRMLCPNVRLRADRAKRLGEI